MSVTEFKHDLTERGTKDEPQRSINAGMNLALIVAGVGYLVIVLFLMALGPHKSEQINAQKYDANVQSTTPHTTVYGNKKVTTDNDKTYSAGEWAVQGDAVMNHGK